MNIIIKININAKMLIKFYIQKSYLKYLYILYFFKYNIITYFYNNIEYKKIKIPNYLLYSE